MNRILLPLVAILLLQTGCNVTLKLEGAEQRLITSAKEDGPETTTFAPTDKTFYARGSTRGANKIEMVWVLESTDGIDQEEEINRESYRPGKMENLFTNHLTLRSGVWPEGTYRVDLYRDAEPPESVRFQVASPET